jgi:hypothetical protein
MNEYDLYQELQHKTVDLDNAVKSLRESGSARAKAERDYKVLLRQKCLELRNQGYAIGMIDKTCYGIEEVAEARFNRDVADALYTANLEAINTIKLEIRLIEAQIEREWQQH